jgi:PadR family transcriptional regulator PadR
MVGKQVCVREWRVCLFRADHGQTFRDRIKEGLPTIRPEDARSERCFPGRGFLPEFQRFCFLLLTEGSECILYSVTEDIKHMSKPSDLVQGTLDMLLLKILALGPMNGFAVSQRLKQVSGDILQVSDGSLYPALHKLEQEGWITAEWKTSEKGRRAKYYSLTRLGRRQLEREADNWGRLSGAISRVVKLKLKEA